jgi:hypothetical protein
MGDADEAVASRRFLFRDNYGHPGVCRLTISGSASLLYANTLGFWRIQGPVTSQTLHPRVLGSAAAGIAETDSTDDKRNKGFNLVHRGCLYTIPRSG